MDLLPRPSISTLFTTSLLAQQEPNWDALYGQYMQRRKSAREKKAPTKAFISGG